MGFHEEAHMDMNYHEQRQDDDAAWAAHVQLQEQELEEALKRMTRHLHNESDARLIVAACGKTGEVYGRPRRVDF